MMNDKLWELKRHYQNGGVFQAGKAVFGYLNRTVFHESLSRLFEQFTNPLQYIYITNYLQD